MASPSRRSPLPRGEDGSVRLTSSRQKEVAEETVSSVHKDQREQALRQAEIAELQRKLMTGTLSDSTDTVATNDAGLAERAKLHVEEQEAMRERRKAQSKTLVPVSEAGGLSERSKQLIEQHQQQAQECFEKLRESLTFAQKHDAHGVVEPAKAINLETFLMQARQRAVRQNRPVESQLQNYERLDIFETEAEKLEREELLKPDIDAEEEVRAQGIKLGLLTEDGKWAPKCDCEAKLRLMQGKAREDALRIAKAKFVTSFVREIDRMVVTVDNFMFNVIEAEDIRKRELADLRDKQYTLINKLQSQSKQIDRLRKKAKDAGARMEDEGGVDAMTELSNMKEYVSLLESGKMKGKIGAGKDAKEVKRRAQKIIRRIQTTTAAHERLLMAQHDVDSYVDPSYQRFLELRKKQKRNRDYGAQTLTDEELLVEHGIIPEYMKKKGGNTALQSQIVKATIPAAEVKGAGWPEETPELEAAMTQLLQFTSGAMSAMEENRIRIMNTVAAVAPSGSDVEVEVGPLFGHTNVVIRDTLNRLQNDLKVQLRKVAAAAQRAMATAQERGRKEGRSDGAPGTDSKENTQTMTLERQSTLGGIGSFADYVSDLERQLSTLKEEKEKGEEEAKKDKDDRKKSVVVKSPTDGSLTKKPSAKKAAATPKASASTKELPKTPKKAVSVKKLKEASDKRKSTFASDGSESDFNLDDIKREQSIYGSMNDLKAAADAAETKANAAEVQFRSLRDLLTACCRSLMRNDVLLIRPDLVGSLEAATAPETIIACATQVANDVQSSAQSMADPSAPHILIETMKNLRKSLEAGMKAAIDVGLTLPSFILPELEATTKFSDTMSVSDLSTVIMKSETHMTALSGSIARQVPSMISGLVDPLRTSVMKIVKQTRRLCNEVTDEIFPKMYVDEPVRELQMLQLRETEEDDSPDTIPFVKYSNVASEALDNLEYFLREYSKSIERDREEEAARRAQEMATELYSRMVADGDKAVLRETNRAAKIKKEVDDRIKAETQRFQEFADQERKRLAQIQAQNEARIEENEKHTAEILRLKEEMIQFQQKRAEVKKQETDVFVQNEETRAMVAKESADSAISEEEQRIMQAQLVLYQRMLLTCQKNEQEERAELEEICSGAFESIANLFESVRGALEEQERRLQPDADDLVEVEQESVEDRSHHPVLGLATPERTPANTDLSGPGSVQSSYFLTPRHANSGTGSQVQLLTSQSPMLSIDKDGTEAVGTQTDPVTISSAKKKSVGVNVRMGANSFSRSESAVKSDEGKAEEQVTVATPPQTPTALEVAQIDSVSDAPLQSPSTGSATSGTASTNPTPKGLTLLRLPEGSEPKEPAASSQRSKVVEIVESHTPKSSTLTAKSTVNPPPREHKVLKQPETRSISSQTIALPVPQSDLPSSVLQVPAISTVDCCVGPLVPIPTFATIESNTTAPLKRVHIGISAAPVTSTIAIQAPKNIRSDAGTLEGSVLSPLAGKGIGSANDPIVSFEPLIQGKDGEEREVSIRHSPPPDALASTIAPSKPAPSAKAVAQTKSLEQAKSELPEAVPPPAIPEVVVSSTEQQQPLSSVTLPAAAKPSPIQLSSIKSQTVINANQISEMMQRPSIEDIELVAQTMSEVFDVFHELLPTSTDFSKDLGRFGPRMLGSWDGMLNELVFYLKDLLAVKQPKKATSAADALLGVKKRNTAAQAVAAARGAICQTDLSGEVVSPDSIREGERLTPVQTSPLATPLTRSSPLTPPPAAIPAQHHPKPAFSYYQPDIGAALEKTLLLEASIDEIKEAALEVHESLYRTLPEIFKRLKLRREVVDPYQQSFGNTHRPGAQVVLGHDLQVLNEVYSLLRKDSLHARRRMSATAEHAAAAKKLDRLIEHRKRNAFPEDIPSVAAFLDRQEKKLRASLAEFSRMKQQVADEKERALRDFFLPTVDVEVVSYMPPVLSRRKVYAGAPPRVNTPVEREHSTATPIRCKGISMMDDELPAHPGNSYKLKRAAFLKPLDSSPQPKVPSDDAGSDRPPLHPPQRSKSLPMLKYDETDGKEGFVDIVARGPPRMAHDHPTGAVVSKGHPIPRHVVIPQRTTMVHPPRDFFLKPLEGHSTKLAPKGQGKAMLAKKSEQ